jgi:hypothetical protein
MWQVTRNRHSTKVGNIIHVCLDDLTVATYASQGINANSDTIITNLISVKKKWYFLRIRGQQA